MANDHTSATVSPPIVAAVTLPEPASDLDILEPGKAEADFVAEIQGNKQPPPAPALAFNSEYIKTGFHSFSGAEARVFASINGILVPLKDLTTISYSVFREKSEVKTLGNSNVRGRTRGTRTVAGTLMFVHTEEHPMLTLLNSKAIRSTFSGSFYTDEIIPMDLMITFTQGRTDRDRDENLMSRLALRGVEFTTESSTWSINQPMTEMVVQYVALSIEPMVRSARPAPGQALERILEDVRDWEINDSHIPQIAPTPPAPVLPEKSSTHEFSTGFNSLEEGLAYGLKIDLDQLTD